MACPFQARVVLYLMLAVVTGCITECIYEETHMFVQSFIETLRKFEIIETLRKFEIRVGVDSEDLGNNPVCHKQLSSVPVSVTFACTVALYGNWVSVNKSSMDNTDLLQLREVRAYGVYGEYNVAWLNNNNVTISSGYCCYCSYEAKLFQ